jgi:histidyl-tRNA synthetase
MSVSTGIPKGTRDFSPIEMNRRKYIFGILEDVFRLYGYLPIETPAMENLSTLTGKYGEEGDRLIFKILNSGDFLSEIKAEELSQPNLPKLATKLCEKALRYDLTVPFARFVVQHRAEITFPFKRYQIQPVWRADRPQRGRYREFFQCDVDVIGTQTLICEVELMRIIDDVFNRLHIPVTIHLNNRKILTGIAEAIGCGDKFLDMTIAIDKIDKIGPEKVKEELAGKGISDQSVDKLMALLNTQGANEDKLEALRQTLANSTTGMKGVEEIETVLSYIDSVGLRASVHFDINLARGLNYYTGAIFEVKAENVQMGSICGGGRYDDLTGIFGLPDVSGVGVSFGADRIYDVMNELSLFPLETSSGSTVLFTNFGGEEERYSLKILDLFRSEGIRSEIYLENAKMKKQFAYADEKKIPFVAIIGSEEMQNHSISLKEMNTGEQTTLVIEEVIKKIKGKK